MNKENQSNETITFLGTGGARFMIISQLLASGGLWFNLDGTQILMDPGPGCIVQVTKRKLNPEELSAIIVSHRHLDHSADVNVMTEAMTEGGFKKRGQFPIVLSTVQVLATLLQWIHNRNTTCPTILAPLAQWPSRLSLNSPVCTRPRILRTLMQWNCRLDRPRVQSIWRTSSFRIKHHGFKDS